ncbi:axoneme assembly protein [Aureococcus anophagefferens]|uniref:Axoneme assembly protein n=1 Tax=Aureococcus anophagefferens TaxID=44056 RepID=A0ABR1FVB3_AURAN
MRSPCAASDFVEQGVIFDIGAFCAALAAKGPEDLEAVAECTLVGLDTDAEPTHELGLVLPALERLRLRQSTVRSFRDFGCDLGRLRVIHAARCGVTDLDGLGSIFTLEELYISFNDVEDCTALALHDELQVLDLESNRVAAAAEVATLGTCEKLSCLTLLGNPVVGALEASGGYAGGVLARVPHLEVLDDAPVGVARRDAAAPVDVVDLAGPADEAALDDFIRQESAVVSEAIKVFRPRTADAAAESRAGAPSAAAGGRPTARARAGRRCATCGAPRRAAPRRRPTARPGPTSRAAATARSRATYYGPRKSRARAVGDEDAGLEGVRRRAEHGTRARRRAPAPETAASPVTDLVRELQTTPLARRRRAPGGRARRRAEARAMAHSLSSPALGSPSRGAAVAPAPSHVPITSVQKQALARKAPQRKKKLQGVSISHMDLARRAAGRADLNRKVRGALPPTP